MNEKYEIIGIGPVKKGTNKAGRPYAGFNLYCTMELKNVDGLACTAFWISETFDLPELSVGNVISVAYNRWGNIASVSVVG